MFSSDQGTETQSTDQNIIKGNVPKSVKMMIYRFMNYALQWNALKQWRSQDFESKQANDWIHMFLPQNI